ncbi:MAG: hypothetical protein ABGW77_04165 [Campylobacterales bacterium]
MGVVLKVLQVILAVDVGVVLFCWLEKRWDWLVNTQLALFSTLLIVVGSFTGYRRLVEKRREGERGGGKSAEVPQKESEKGAPLSERLLIGIGGSLNPLRILGYGALIGSFFYLQNNYLFQPIPFLFGVSIVPALSLLVSYLNRGG